MEKQAAARYQQKLKLRSVFKKNANEYVGAKWNSEQDKLVCPICQMLDDLGWLPFDAFPDINQAHSQLGGPGWNASDASCRCTVDFERREFTDAELAMGPEDVQQMWFDTYATLSSQQKEFKGCCCQSNKKHKSHT